MSPFLSRFTITLCSLLSLSSLALAQKASIEANVKGADGHPPKNAQIRIESLDKQAKAVVVKPDARGFVSVTKLEAGSYRVSAIVDGKVQSSQKVKAGANNPAVVSFKTSNASSPVVSNGAKTKIVGQKRYVWVPGQVGSRFGGYWKEAGSIDKPSETGADAVGEGGGSALDQVQHQTLSPTAPSTGGR